MTKAEETLRRDLREAGFKHEIDAIIDVVRGDEYFVLAGEIRALEYTEWLDWEDSSDMYYVVVEDLPEDDDE